MGDIGPAEADLAQHEGHVLERLVDLGLKQNRLAGELQTVWVPATLPRQLHPAVDLQHHRIAVVSRAFLVPAAGCM